MPKHSKATVKRATKIPAPRDFPPPERLKVEPEELSPAEWDFRKIRPGQLDAAIYYEYARSCDWVLEVFKRWHEKTFPVRHKSAALRKWHGRTVAEILNRPEAEVIPQEVEAWCSEEMPGELKTDTLEQLLDISPIFPKPFLEVAFPGTLHMRLPRYQDHPSCWEDLGAGAVSGRRWLNSPVDDVNEVEAGSQHESKRRIVVDLRFAKTRIKKELWNLIDRLDDSKVKKHELPKGKAAAWPWVRLKELAAYRLVTATAIKYANMRHFVREYRKKSPVPGKLPVLPDYAQGGVSEAVTSVMQYMHELFPKPE